MLNFNIKETYVHQENSWSGILASAAFTINPTANGLKGYSMGQLVFFCDMILLMKHMVDWELLRQRKQAQINRDNIRKNSKRVDHD